MPVVLAGADPGERWPGQGWSRVCASDGPEGRRGADRAITSAIDAHIVTEQGRDDDDGGSAGVLAPVG